MPTGMRRGTPSAELFGQLVALIRTAGTGASMRQMGDKLGSPAATISQIEKGQRALKEPKLAAWASALEIEESDLRELWNLSLGEVLQGDRRVFYAKANYGYGEAAFGVNVQRELAKQPELEPIYGLAHLIAAVLTRSLPHVGVQVEPLEFEPLYLDEGYAGVPLTAAQEDEQADHAAAFLALPVIECYWDSLHREGRRREINERFYVSVPLLAETSPIVRRRTRAMESSELEDLIRTLTGTERERVRGYVDSIIEQRGAKT